MRGTLGIFCSSKKRKNEENSGRARSVINSGDAEVNKIINRTSRHFISLSFYYNTYQNMSHHIKCNVQPAVMSISYAANILNERCPWPRPGAIPNPESESKDESESESGFDSGFGFMCSGIGFGVGIV